MGMLSYWREKYRNAKDVATEQYSEIVAKDERLRFALAQIDMAEALIYKILEELEDHE